MPLPDKSIVIFKLNTGVSLFQLDKLADGRGRVSIVAPGGKQATMEISNRHVVELARTLIKEFDTTEMCQDRSETPILRA